ncbi:MAG: hypothetical protein Q9219_000253 [cf. Caloplaca sp. 3 TL-2023]
MSTEARPRTQNTVSLTALPIEIITQILPDLDKSQLKKLRLVCHYLNEACLSRVFDKVIASRAGPNFMPFHSITSTRRLNIHVKKIVCDLQTFEETTAAYYIRDVCTQFRGDILARLGTAEQSALPVELTQTLEACNYFEDPGTTHDREKILRPFIIHIREGFRTYRKRWQADNSHTVKILSFVKSALRKCPNVREIELRGSWDFHYQPLNGQLESILPTYPSSGLVARQWHPLYLRPKSPGISLGPLNGHRLVEDVFDIIKRSGQRISRFSIHEGITICHKMHSGTRSMSEHMPIAFRNLVSLSLDVSVVFDPDLAYSLDHLCPALQAAQGLKDLAFRASNYSVWRHRDSMRIWIYPLLRHCIFPRLTSLRLSAIKASPEEFLEIFWNQPVLESLDLNLFLVMDWPKAGPESWRRLFEGLRQLSLKECSINWYGVPMGGMYRTEDAMKGLPRCKETKDMLEKYVLSDQDDHPFPTEHVIELFNRPQST